MKRPTCHARILIVIAMLSSTQMLRSLSAFSADQPSNTGTQVSVSLNNRANALASQFQMTYEGARQLTAQGKMTQTGDKSTINVLMDKAASRLGMSSSTALRNQILPSLGIDVSTMK